MARGEHTAAELVAAHRDAVLEAWIQSQKHDPRIRVETIGAEGLRRDSARLLDGLLDALSTGGDDPAAVEGAAYAPVRDLLSEVALRRERLGLPASGTAAWAMSIKDHWVAPLLAADGPAETAQQQIQALSRVVDTLALITYDEVVRRREATIRQQAEEIMEISTPVIRVWEGVVAAPLIGTLDSERTQRFMERLLQTIAATNSPVALVDITGVPTVDTQTAQHLIDTVSAVKLMGSRVILTGVRPSIAQTLVHLGISMGDITTRASFAAGLRVAMGMLGIELPSAGAEPRSAA